MKKLLYLIPLIGLLLAGCQKKDAEVKSRIFAMDTYMDITVYGENAEIASSEIKTEILRLDSLLNAESSDSEISRINSAGSGAVSGDTSLLISKALELYDSTDGAFDISLHPISVLWGFPTGKPSLPEADDIKKALAFCGSDKISFNADTAEITLGENQSIDLGGIAKGYASDYIMNILKKYNCSNGLVSLGGNVQAYGKKPDGSLWKVGIKNPTAPDDSSSFLGIVCIADKAVVTSAGYERNFTDENGKLWHHIIDPKTGYSANSGIISATIVSSSGILADGLSTACYVMGTDASMEYWKSHRDDFDMILMTDDERLLITSGLSNYFSSDYTYEIIE